MTDEVVYSSPNLVLVAHRRVLLETAGIPAWIRNEFLAGAAGELPPIECWPQLRVPLRWSAAARELLAAADAPVVGLAAWTCPGCGEHIEPQFAACWNCGQEA